MCSISYAFGLFDESNNLQGICTFGKPPSPSLCTGVCGEENSKYVFELNRLCVNDNLPKNTLSFFVSKCLKILPDMIVVSYADTSQNHHGYIYQATNWIYTGLSAKRTEWKDKNNINGHSKTLCEQTTLEERKENDRYVEIERSQKHRYIYFVGSKTRKKKWKIDLNYKIETYPKGDNKRYDSSYKPLTQFKIF
jgi:hypothetical protein